MSINRYVFRSAVAFLSSSTITSRAFCRDMDFSPQSQNLLLQLPPHPVFDYFVKIMEFPRPSKKEDKIRDWLIQWARKHDFDWAKDEIGNLRIRRKASPGFINSPKIVVQGHIDMVTTKLPSKKHDFETDPIIGLVEDGWLTADGTTLGADNGVGVAAGLALLEDKNLRCGQLELLVTVDEEMGMSGAKNVSSSLLDSDVLINLDSEEDHAMCIGCAGAFQKDFSFLATKSQIPPDFAALTLNLSGLAGGHSGINIHEDRANAIKIWSDLLLLCGPGTRIIKFEGGNARNAIPSHVNSVIAVKKERVTEVQLMLQQELLRLEEYYQAAESPCPNRWNIQSEQVELPNAVGMDERSSQRLLDVIAAIPNGVQRFDPASKMADMSLSIGLGRLNDDGMVSFIAYVRCPSMERMKWLDRKLSAIGRACGIQTNDFYLHGGAYPGWDPDINSSCVKIATETHEKLFNMTPHINTVHAGLEVGVIMRTYPDLKAISIGPLITGAHSTDERLKIDTVEPFYLWLRAMIETIASDPTGISAAAS